MREREVLNFAGREFHNYSATTEKVVLLLPKSEGTLAGVSSDYLRGQVWEKNCPSDSLVPNCDHYAKEHTGGILVSTVLIYY